MGVVKTIEGICSICFSCIRNCPVKAIKVEKGQATVIPDLCIYCGHCIEVCSKQAKCVRSSMEALDEIMRSDELKIACLAPSYIAEFVEVNPGQVAAALKRAGFDLVYEVAFGAQLVAQAYRDLILQQKSVGMISTSCPSIVFLVEKYFPSLIPKLVPIVSPMVALGRYLKHQYTNRKVKVIFIGPCSAKKAEMQEESLIGSVDCVLTFPELNDFFRLKGVNLHSLESEGFDSPSVHAAKIFPLAGGLLKTAALHADILENRIVTVEGRENSLNFLRNAAVGNIQFDFADILFCNGCISGPMFSEKRDVYSRMHLLKEYTQKKEEFLEKSSEEIVEYNNVNLKRNYQDKSVFLANPLEKEIQEVLFSLEKYTKEDELNCGACGYETCRNKAVAVIRGLAENEMCLPYLINKLEKSNLLLKSQLQENSSGVGRFIGNSRPMQQVYQMIKKVARTDTTVLIVGESGTGKELAAQALHELSLRSDESFVSINCAAIPETLLESELFGHVKGSFTGAVSDKKGLFEEAHKGTILLDEIGDVSLTLQVKLLRVLQEGEFLRIGDTRPKKVNVRVIAATNKDLQNLIEKGAFRVDLYYRLNVVSIKLPPLRDRREDIPILAITFLQRFNKKLGASVSRIDNATMEVLMHAEWKGNVRELENAIERAVLLSDGSEIRVEDLPPELINERLTEKQSILGEDFSLKEHMDQYQKEIILKALEKNDWVQAKAAKMLGLNRSTLHEILRRYNL